MEREKSDPQEETVRRALCDHMLLEGESAILDVSFVLVLISIVSYGMCNQEGDSTPLECRIFFLRLRTYTTTALRR
jgi:hypothetical protein